MRKADETSRSESSHGQSCEAEIVHQSESFGIWQAKARSLDFVQNVIWQYL